MQRAAIADHLPVLDAGRAHLCFEGHHLVGRRQRIVGAGADQYAGLRLAGHGRRFGREHAMKAHDGLEVRAIARQFEHDRAPEAEADGAQPAGIDLRQCGERRQGRAAPRPELRRLIAQRREQGARLLEVAGLPAVAEHVGRQGNVAEPGNHAGALHGMVVEPQPFVDDQHAGPPLPCRLVVVQKSTQACRAVAIGEVLCQHPEFVLAGGRREQPVHEFAEG